MPRPEPRYLRLAMRPDETSRTGARVASDLINTAGIVSARITQAFVDFRGTEFVVVARSRAIAHEALFAVRRARAVVLARHRFAR